jgi:hypothetical protein
VCPLLKGNYYVYTIIIRSKSVYAKQLIIYTSNAKPKWVEYNCASRVYPAK